MSTFATKADAITAGYRFPRGNRPIYSAKGLELCIKDISGGKSFGYSYAIVPGLTDAHRYEWESSEWQAFLKTAEGRCLAKSSNIKLTDEKNAGGTTGCYVEAFSPEQIDKAKQALDEIAAAYAAELSK